MLNTKNYTSSQSAPEDFFFNFDDQINWKMCWFIANSQFYIRTVSKEHVENCLAGLTLYHLDIANSMTNRIYSIFCAYLYSISTIGTSVIELVFCELYLSLFETFPSYKKLQKLVLWSRKFLFQILSRLRFFMEKLANRKITGKARWAHLTFHF